MIIILIVIILLLIGIIILNKTRFETTGITLIITNSILLFILGLTLMMKPLDYRNFEIDYETLKETMTSKDDIRDATFPNKLIEVNSKIKRCQKLKDDLLSDILIDKRICEHEYLKKGE